jgi:hypothetical protein
MVVCEKKTEEQNNKSQFELRYIGLCNVPDPLPAGRKARE